MHCVDPDLHIVWARLLGTKLYQEWMRGLIDTMNLSCQNQNDGVGHIFTVQERREGVQLTNNSGSFSSGEDPLGDYVNQVLDFQKLIVTFANKLDNEIIAADNRGTNFNSSNL